jgi:sugar lactone lactonase YvrE/DNA-directed RNA polymerase subunit RPC12/RpoP
MVHTFQCPNCHASLNYDPGSRTATVRCDYCSSTIIVPETLRQAALHDTGRPAGAAAAGQAQKLAEIAQLAHGGQKIQAIKLFRETFDTGLKEAKDVVEAIERNDAIRLEDITILASTPATDASPVPRRSASCLILAVVLMVGLAALVPILLGGGLAFFTISSVETSAGTPASSISLLSTQLPAVLAQPTQPPAATATPGLAAVVWQMGGQEGIGPGFFNDTRRLGLDGAGNIYTGDYSGGRVQVFDPDGEFLGQWNAGSELYMIGMAVDRQGVVYVVDRGQILRYEGLTGAALGPLPYAGQASFRHVATAADGSLVAFAPDRLVRFDAQGNVTLEVRDPFSNIPDFATTSEDLAVDGAGNIYVLGTESIYKFDADGRFVNQIGSRGEAADQFSTSVTAIAVDGQGRIFAEDFKGILVLDANGRYLGTIDFRGVAFDMVIDGRNELLVMDRNGNQVLRYTVNE